MGKIQQDPTNVDSRNPYRILGPAFVDGAHKALKYNIHNVSASFESIAAQAESRSSSMTWRIHSMHVEADLLSSDGNLHLKSLDWMDHQSPLDSLPITPPSLQQQLDSISQLSHERRAPSFPSYWGRKHMHSWTVLKTDGTLRNVIFLAGLAPKERAKLCTDASLESGSTDPLPEASAPGLARNTNPSSRCAGETRREPPPLGDVGSLTSARMDELKYTHTLRTNDAASRTAVFTAHRDNVGNRYPRFDTAFITYQEKGGCLGAIKCSCSTFARASSDQDEAATLAFVHAEMAPLCGHYSLDVVAAARDAIANGTSTGGACVAHNCLLFSVTDQLEVTFVEKTEDVYLCDKQHCGGKTIARRKKAEGACEHARSVRSVYPVEAHGQHQRPSRSHVTDEWIQFEPDGIATLKQTDRIPYSQCTVDPDWLRVIDWYDGLPTQFFDDTIQPMALNEHRWKTANVLEGHIPKLEVKEPPIQCPHCAGTVEEDAYQCWVATTAGLVLVDLINQRCPACAVTIGHADEAHGIYIYERPPKAIPVGVTLLYSFNYVAGLGVATPSFKAQCEQLKRGFLLHAHGNLFPEPTSLTDTSFKKVSKPQWLQTSLPNQLRVCILGSSVASNHHCVPAFPIDLWPSPQVWDVIFLTLMQTLSLMMMLVAQTV